MKKTVYLDSTLFSFYYDERSDSKLRSKITVDWIDNQSKYYDCYTSYFTLVELKNPVYPNWQKAAKLAEKYSILEYSEEILGIIKTYIDHKIMPSDESGDAAHLALASYHEVDYLLTWNCKHLANANKIDHIRNINMRLGLITPLVITPEQLFMEI